MSTAHDIHEHSINDIERSVDGMYKVSVYTCKCGAKKTMRRVPHVKYSVSSSTGWIVPQQFTQAEMEARVETLWHAGVFNLEDKENALHYIRKVLEMQKI